MKLELKINIMKKILPLLVLMAMMVSSCYYEEDPYYYEEDPYADFSASSLSVEPYEIVYFSNYSTDAYDYYWDFGDGYTSNSFNPQHYYEEAGTYEVSLTVRNRHGGEDIAYTIIEVYYEYTDLEITVAEWNRSLDPSILVSNAEVTLYTSYDDWYSFSFPVETRYTNSRGVVVFTDLDPISYYIDVYHANYENNVLGQEELSYIRTTPLQRGALNTFIAWVDYFPTTIQASRSAVRVPYKLDREKRVYKKVEVLK